MLPDPYPVPVWSAPCRGSVSLPGSKSITNRALILAALSKNRVRLNGALFSRDSRILCEALRVLGFEVEENEAEKWIEVQGASGRIPNRSCQIDVGNAGTAARFLTALVCLAPDGVYAFDGDEEMRERPMGGLIHSLKTFGAEFSFEGKEGHFPFKVRPSGLSGGAWFVDASASSQMLSALLMIAPFAGDRVTIEAMGARPAFVEMTARMMRQFGGSLEGSPGSGYAVEPSEAYRIASDVYGIEPDATAASYFVALPLVVGGTILIKGMSHDMLQGDVAFANVMKRFGLEISQQEDGWLVEAGHESPEGPFVFSFETFSDTFLTLAAIAPLLPGPVRIEDIGHTRHQETDRVAAMARELARAGVEVEEGTGYLLIGPTDSFRDVVINTYKDHRVAMSFALLGSRDLRGNGRPWLQIADPGCCAKTFPEYFKVLLKLYQNSHDK